MPESELIAGFWRKRWPGDARRVLFATVAAAPPDRADFGAAARRPLHRRIARTIIPSMNGILIIAHAPLAHALRSCAVHVFPDCEAALAAIDVQPNLPPEESLAMARIAMEQLRRSGRNTGVLVLTDMFGATPSNVAQKLVDGVSSRLITGVNLPMLLRAVSYRQEPIEALVSRAVVGGTQGVMQVAVTAPQNQPRRTNDNEHDDHQQ
jgi:mannose PTS system EIIA component